MNQLFVKIPEKEVLFNFLNLICDNIDNNFFIINKISFKKACYKNLISSLYIDLKDYYIKSKQFYLEREVNYKNFLTIIRQLCNCLNIKFIYLKIFNNSNYEIIYKINKN